MVPCAMLTVIVLVFLEAAAAAQGRYSKQPASPDGIGTRYMGREIAHIMGYEGASWLERPERQTEERIDALIQALDLKPGAVVADVGAGTGTLSRLIGAAVGPSGRVYATDVQPQMVKKLEAIGQPRGAAPVVAVTSTTDDARLPANSIDLAIMVDVYHELERPYELVESIVRALKPGGRLVFVEYRAEDPNVPIKELHKMSEAQVRREATTDHALRFLRTDARLPWQHIVMFAKTDLPQ